MAPSVDGKRRGSVLPGLLWASLSVWPHGLCYTNELWGGTANGYRCLSDSNYDWGQGLKELARVARSASGTRSPCAVLRHGYQPRRLPMSPLAVDGLQLGPDDLPAPAQGHTLAVGTSIVYGSVSEIFPDLKAAAQALREIEADRSNDDVSHLPTCRPMKHCRRRHTEATATYRPR